MEPPAYTASRDDDENENYESDSDSVKDYEFEAYKKEHKLDHDNIIARLQALEAKLSANNGKPTPELQDELGTIAAAAPQNYADPTIVLNINTPEGKAAFDRVLTTLKSQFFSFY